VPFPTILSASSSNPLTIQQFNNSTIQQLNLYLIFQQTNTARTGFSEGVPGIDTGVVAVGPEELEGIAANGRNLFQTQIGLSRVADFSGVGRATHVSMAAFAFDTRTNRPQPIKRIGALMPIIPGNEEGLFLAVGRYICWSGHNLTQRRRE
jgi:hypothetical protein